MGKLTAIRHQENPDGLKGHEERQQLQEASKQFPAKRKYTGGEQHWYTRPQISKTPKKQLRDLQRLEMKANCEDYTDQCKLNSCSVCATRDERTQKVIEKAKVLIDKFEKHSTGTEFQEDYLR